MIDELDTWHTDEIVCPECEHKFELESEEYVVYTTSKVDWLKQWREYNRAQIRRAEWEIWKEEHTVKVRFDE